MSYSGTSPKRPNDYTGQRNGVVPAVSRNRRPTTADYRQPETGRNYPITCIWQVSKSPTTGSEGELWALSKIVGNVATWTQMGANGSSGIVSVTGDNTTVVTGDGAGDLDLNGTTVASGVNNQAVYVKGTDADPVHKQEVQVQLATTTTGPPVNANDAGVSSFNVAQFTVDTTSGQVGLIGGSTPPLLLLALDDTNNATANGSGVITLGGTAVVNADKPLFTKMTPLTSDIDLQIQIAKQVDPTADVIANAGIASFNENQFDVDAVTGMASLKGSTADNAVLTVTAQGPTSGGPDSSGVLDFVGAGGASVSITGNQVIVTAGATGGGLVWREEVTTSATFTSNEGIFANNTNPITLTLPSAPTVGHTFAAYQEGSGVVRIQAQGSDIIKYGNQSTPTGGYIESKNEGDSVWIVAVDDTRFRVINTGSWTVST